MPIQQKKVLLFISMLVIIAGIYSLAFGPMREQFFDETPTQLVEEVVTPSDPDENNVSELMNTLVKPASRDAVMNVFAKELKEHEKIQLDGTYSCSFDSNAVTVTGDAQTMTIISKELGEAQIRESGILVKQKTEATFSAVPKNGPINEGMMYGLILNELQMYVKDVPEACE